MLSDALMITIASVASGISYSYHVFGSIGEPSEHMAVAAIVSALFIAFGSSSNLYDSVELLNFKSQVQKIAFKWVGIFLFLAAIGFAMKLGQAFSRGVMISFFVTGFVLLVGERAAWRIVLERFVAVRRFSGRKAVLIADKVSTDRGIRDVLRRHGVHVAHQVSIDRWRGVQDGLDGIAKSTVALVRGSDIDEIVVGADIDGWTGLDEFLSGLRAVPVPVTLVPFGSAAQLFRLPARTIGDNVAVELQRGPRTVFERGVKRATDIVIASIALILTLPLLILTAVAIRLDSPGPVLFRQRRCGFNGCPFYIFKFRSMSVMEDGRQIVQAQKNDSRITRVGAWLRRTSIDELPQLFNVLAGSMSVIGPRPHALAHDDEFQQVVGKYAFRHHVKPGMTGWAQVNGCRGRTPTVEQIEKRVRLDLWYIDNWSLALDCKIMAMTVLEVLRGENAY
jgi:putative colanic acid biosynthesis UDP-glucose lipid carrier transferase